MLRPRQLVGRGTTVRLVLASPPGAPSIAAPPHQTLYTVPEFRGPAAGTAYDWIHTKLLPFKTNLGPLRAATAPRLLDNYRVTRQDPAQARSSRSRPRAGSSRR